MAHLTFVHGIKNKPPADELLEAWRDTLSANGGINSSSFPISMSMVYWADVLYAEPELAAEDSLGDEPVDDSVINHDLAKAATDPKAARFLAGLAGKLTVATLKSAAEEDLVSEDRVPIPWFLKGPLMSALLRDVHHYLFNTRYRPRAGIEYRVQDEIRKRFVQSLKTTTSRSRPHIVVSHSMGTVIAYDCLKRVADCPTIDALVTIGSPLGLDEIQDQMQPEWTRNDGFPSGRVTSWVNVFDKLDPVAGFDPLLRNDYLKNGKPEVLDIEEPNWGAWRHDISKYLSGPRLRSALRSLLGMTSAPDAPQDSALGDRTPCASGSFDHVRTWLGTVNDAMVSDEASIAGRPIESVEFSAAIGDAISHLQSEAFEAGTSLMTACRDRLASLLQSHVSRLPVASSATVQDMAFDKDDTKRALKDIFDQAKKQKKHSPARPRSMVPERLPNNARIFLVSDFGTGLYGAPVINKTVLAGEPFDLLLHLGDIYYSGTEEEVGERFLRHWPMAAGHVSRTLNGNHDMYSGGYGYFDVALPAFRQESSYFALQNDNWLLIGLDTAYKDNSIGRKQRHWIDRIVDEAGDRRLILFSHHPLFSNFKEAGEKLAKGLEHLLVSRRIDAWYWGHEHHCVIYDRHPIFGLRGRCLGNGGMPSKRSKLNSFAVERSLGNIQWRRGPNVVTPRSLYLDGPNHFIPENPSEYGPHGYMTLSLRSNRVTEQVHLAGGEVVFEGTY